MVTRKKAMAAFVLGVATMLPSAAFSTTASAASLDERPLIHYSFNQKSSDSTIVNEGTAPDSDGHLSGDADIEKGSLTLTGSQFVSVPMEAVKGTDDITISMWLKNNFGSGNTAAAYIGNGDTSKGYFLLNPSNPKGYVKAVMTGATQENPSKKPYDTETGPGSTKAATSGAKATDDMALYTVAIHGSDGTMSVYLNGEPVGDSSYKVPGGLKNYGDLVGFIGKSAYPDPYTKIRIDDYALYGTALQTKEIKDIFSNQVIDETIAQTSVPETAIDNFPVRTGMSGVSVKWESDSPAIRIEGGQAFVTRPQSTQSDAKVTLTATFEYQGASEQRHYKVVVPKERSDKEDEDADFEDLKIENAEDIRTNFSLPTAGVNGSTISWSKKEPQNVYAEIVDGVNEQTKTVKISRPSASKPAVNLILCAEVKKGTAPARVKELKVTIQPMPVKNGEDQAYVWSFFTGEGVGGEKVSLAASKGNNALDWNTLNKGKPLFESSKGERGLRDPSIVRSKDGDKFFMLATDLKINGRPNSPGGLSGFSGAQADGSKYLEIWESDDLVHWSDQRHVKVSTDKAGNTWAPEAYWDETIGKYVVHWASNLYDTDDLSTRTELTYNRLMYATTDDFVTFSEPKPWVDVDRRGGPGSGSIDATVQKEGDTYYRVYKDEKTMTVRQEKSTDLLATVSGSYPQKTDDVAPDQWSLVGEEIGAGQSNGYGGTFRQGEGPSLFKANKGDVNGYQYYLFVDQPNYHGGPNHYVPMATSDISDANKWKVIGDKMPEANFPTNTDGGKPRHGTVLPVTRAQYQTVLEAYAPNVAVKSVDAMSITTRLGDDPTAHLPTHATLRKQDGTVETPEVKWETINPSSYAHTGSFTVQGVAQDDSRMPVEVTVTVVSDDTRLKSLTIAGNVVDVSELQTRTVSLYVDDPVSVGEHDVVAVSNDPTATVGIHVENQMVSITVHSSAGPEAVYQVKLLKKSQTDCDTGPGYCDPEHGCGLPATGSNLVWPVSGMLLCCALSIGVFEFSRRHAKRKW